MDAGGSGLLGEALDEDFHFLGCHIHQVCKFIDDNKDIRHLLIGVRFVVAFDISHPRTGKELVARFHFPHGPVQCALGFLHVCHHFGTQVGNAIVNAQLYHLRVDEHELHFVRSAMVNDAGDDGIDAHTLAAAGGAGDQEMRRFGEIGHHGLAGNVFP